MTSEFLSKASEISLLGWDIYNGLRERELYHGLGSNKERESPSKVIVLLTVWILLYSSSNRLHTRKVMSQFRLFRALLFG
jgi:hypothetical protein